MDPNTEIQTDCTPLFIQYKSGRVERLLRSDSVPAGLDPSTGVTSKDITINSTTSARLYLPKATTTTKKLPILFYFHGGGFVVGSAFSLTYHPFLTSLTSKSQSLVVSVDYRLAPEHPLPAAYDDCWSAINWAFSASADPWIVRYGDLDRVFVAGDSAGANISHHMAMGAEARSVRLEGIILIHAYFWGSEPVGSETRDPATRGWMARLWKAVSSTDNLDDPRLNPMAVSAPSLRGLGCRRLMVCVAGEDVMAERGRAYYEAVKGSGWGGEAELVETEGEVHVFHLETPDCERAAELVDTISGFLREGRSSVDN